MTIAVRAFRAEDADAWDAFCADCLQSTLLHTRRFLSYHGDRFVDQSLIIEEDGGWVGLFPAAESPQDQTVIVSHPGVTYGGVLHQGRLQGARLLSAFEMIAAHYASRSPIKLLYKAVPAFYHRVPAQDDLYALFRLGAQRGRCDLSSTIDLHTRLPASQRRRRSLKKAAKAGVSVIEGRENLERLWQVLADNLARKHGVEPVHSLAEIELLADRFPGEIRCICAALDHQVVAGTVLFVTPTAFHAQYIAASEVGYDVSALDAVFEYCIAVAVQQGRRWFDFGISTEKGGTVLNDGLYGFKSEFGGGGMVHEFYELDLSK